jgi:tetratricopeptide (TPR) repeat protein
MMSLTQSWLVVVLLAPALWASGTALAAGTDAVNDLQHEWEVIKYQVPQEQQAKRYEALAARARKVCEANPGAAEPLVWEGIILSSWAGAKGGLGALGLVKQAKARYEEAIRIQPDVLDGSAYNSLGVLYYKVPGWPVGFGDDKKAQELLRKALAINPDGIDPNFFYGEYLFEQGKAKEATAYLERALRAPPRPGRDIADAGRREEARKLLEEARRKAG